VKSTTDRVCGHERQNSPSQGRPSSASAKPSISSTASRPTPSFQAALRRFSPPAPVRASRRMRSTASPPTATIATMPCDSQPALAFRNCVTQACNGVAVAAGRRELSLVPPRRLQAACGLRRRICALAQGSSHVRGRWNGVRLRQCGPRDYRRDGFPGPARRDIAAQRFAMKCDALWTSTASSRLRIGGC